MALSERQRSGLGQFLETTLYESGLAVMHQHAASRGDVIEKDWYKGVASPIRLERTKSSLRSVPPTFGEHTA